MRDKSVNCQNNQRYIGWTNKFSLNPALTKANMEKLTHQIKPQSLISEMKAKTHIPNFGKKLAVILNNASFVDYYSDRYGTGADVINITAKLLDLSYELKIKANLKGTEILEFFKELSSDSSLNSYDHLVVFILTHGGTDVIFGIDNIPVRTEEIFELFSDDCCPYLLGKKKGFVINACRGSMFHMIFN